MDPLDDFSKAPENFDKPDPEYADLATGVTNRIRARRVSRALRAYVPDDVEDGPEELVRSFLTDLLHWCDGHGIDVNGEMARARLMYEEEQP